MPKRRVPESAPLPTTGAPPEILVGAVEAVWGPRARSSYAEARRRWVAEEGLTVAESMALAPGPRAAVDGDAARARLARLGLDESDIPALRAAALQRLD